ncbi:DUF4377 domain-containing protein [Bacterioplanoides sp.]|uniref:DUF4377 domain-containing protein n=1 Tax=Bacterioplanoides sp. TaxID=2066072 RepID=UPI003B00583B
MNFMLLYLLVLITFLVGCGSGSSSSGSDRSAQVEDTQTLFVDHHKSECTGVATYLCLRVRNSPDDEWRYFYSSIQGFEYQPGYNYQLKVAVEAVETPPADSSGRAYSLVEVLSKTKEPAETVFDISVSESERFVKLSENIYQLYNDQTVQCDAALCSILDDLLIQKMAMLIELKHAEQADQPMMLSQIKCSAAELAFAEACLL